MTKKRSISQFRAQYLYTFFSPEKSKAKKSDSRSAVLISIRPFVHSSVCPSTTALAGTGPRIEERKEREKRLSDGRTREWKCRILISRNLPFSCDTNERVALYVLDCVFSSRVLCQQTYQHNAAETCFELNWGRLTSSSDRPPGSSKQIPRELICVQVR